MKKTQLSRAIAFALTGAALSMGAVTEASAASTTMYNLYRANFAGYNDPNDVDSGAIYTATSTIPCSPCSNFITNPIGPDNGSGNATDGWVWSANPNGPNNSPSFGQTAANADPSRPGWVGIGGSSTPTLSTPFGYTARPHLNWAVEFTAHGSAQISNADAIARYQQSADIDAAAGAWLDNAATSQGWKHDLDVGLFRSTQSGQVTLNVQGINHPESSYGFAVFNGMSPNINGSYSHHGSWNRATVGGQLVIGNRNQVTGAVQTTASSVPGQFGFTVSDLVAYSVADNPLTAGFDAINLNTITFDAVAGQIYTIMLGGYRDDSWGTTRDGYRLTVSQVPLPGAAWLFGGALVSLFGANRRKRAIPA